MAVVVAAAVASCKVTDSSRSWHNGQHATSRSRVTPCRGWLRWAWTCKDLVTEGMPLAVGFPTMTMVNLARERRRRDKTKKGKKVGKVARCCYLPIPALCTYAHLGIRCAVYACARYIYNLRTLYTRMIRHIPIPFPYYSTDRPLLYEYFV